MVVASYNTNGERTSRVQKPRQRLYPRFAFKRRMSTRVARSVGGPYIESIGEAEIIRLAPFNPKTNAKGGPGVSMN